MNKYEIKCGMVTTRNMYIPEYGINHKKGVQ